MITVLTYPSDKPCDSCDVDTQRGVIVHEISIHAENDTVFPTMYLCERCRMLIGQGLIGPDSGDPSDPR